MNKKFKRCLSCFLAMLMVFSTLPFSVGAVNEEDTTKIESEVTYYDFGEGLQWGFDETTGKLTIKGSGAMPDYAISDDFYTAYENFDIYDYFGLSKEPLFTGNPMKSASLAKAKSLSSFGISTISEEGEEEALPPSPWEKLSGKIKSVVIEEGVTYIGSSAFDFMFYLESVSLPNTLEEIGAEAFAFDIKLSEVNFPSSLKTISDVAFGLCYLNNLKLPKTIETIGSGAFSMVDITSLEFEGDIENISSEAFEGCMSIKTLTIPKDAKNVVDAFSDIMFFDPELIINKSTTYSFMEDKIGEISFSSGEYKGFYKKYVYISTMCYSIIDLLAEILIDVEADDADEQFDALAIDVMCKYLGVNSLEEALEMIDNSILNIQENGTSGYSTMNVVCEENSEEHKAASKYGINHKISGKDENCNCFNFGGNLTDSLTWKIDNDTRTLYFEGSGSIQFPYNEEECTRESAPWLYLCGRYDTIDFSKAEINDIASNAFYHTGEKELVLAKELVNVESDAFSDSKYSITLAENVQSFDLSSLDIISVKKLTVLGSETELTGEIDSNVTVYGGIDFAAETYAKKNNLNYVYVIDNIEENDESDFYIETSHWYEGCHIKKYVGTSKIVHIPEEINGYKVTSIYNDAFKNTGVEYIILPEWMTEIGYLAFEGLTSLKTIYMPDTIKTIRGDAFKGCTSLKTIVFSNSLEKIEELAFYGCSSLKYIDLPESLTVIGSSAFADCSSLKAIEFPKNLKEISDYAFAGCTSLTEVEIPESVVSVWEYTFSNCTSLKKVKSGSQYIEVCAFKGDTSLEEIVLTETTHTIFPMAFLGINNLHLRIESANCWIYLGDVELDEDMDPDEFDMRIVEDDATIYGYTGSTAEAYAKKYNVNFVSIGECDEISSEKDFRYKENADGTLTITNYVGTSRNVVTPKTINGKAVTKIGDSAFENLRIKSLVVSEGITEIDINAFNNCEEVETLSLPTTLKKIGDAAFTDFYLIEEVILPENLESIGYLGLAGFTSMKKLVLPESLTTIGHGAFAASFELEEITIPKNVKSIGLGIFFQCAKLKNIIVDEDNPYYSSVDGILYNKDQTSLIYYPEGKKEVTHTVSENIENIEESAFTNNETLEEVIIPESVSVIGSGAFENCTSLTNVVIEDGSASGISTYALSRAVDTGISINDSAFKGCTSLETVVIPKNVSYIGSGAFYGCSKLNKIIILNDNCEITVSKIEGEYTIPSGTVIHASKGSTAEEYATEQGLTFEAHNYEIEKIENATCTSAEYTTYTCDGCNATYTEKTAEANDHDIVIDKAVPATCTSTGLTQGEHCKNCGYTVAQEVTPKLNHDIVIDKAVPATCTSAGLTQGEHCKNCGYIVRQEVIEAIGHIDNDNNGKCDFCGENIGTNSCSHICHKNDGFSAFIYKILLFFWKLFNTNRYCECGVAHY